MAIDIDSFKGGLSSGFARPNRYEIKITSMGNAGSADNNAINLLASAVTLPGRTIATQEVAQHRETYKHAYTNIDDDVTVTFIIPNDFYPRTLVDKWMKNVINPFDYTLGYKNDYAGTIEISAVSAKDGKPTYGVRLNKAFPTSMSAIQMGNDNENSIMTMDVTFAYDFFDSMDSTGGSISGKVDSGNAFSAGISGGKLSLNINTPLGYININ